MLFLKAEIAQLQPPPLTSQKAYRVEPRGIMSESFIAAAAVRAADARTAAPRAREQRAAFANVGGPHPLDADTVDLAAFPVGWAWLVRDLQLGLSEASAAAVEAFLDDVGLRSAFVVRDNLVNYKKVLLGIYRSSVCLSHDLRRLVTFFRAPPSTFADGETGEAAAAGGDGRAFFRPSVHRQLSDALSATDGAVGCLLDGRRFTKAVCCVPRHPDAHYPARGVAPVRVFGQPAAHCRIAGLLSEPLPGALKCWRLLVQAREA